MKFWVKKITYIKKINFLATTRLFNFVNFFFFFANFRNVAKTNSE